MKDSSYKKSLVLGIFILFIVSGVVPSISGYTGKTSIQSTKEVTTSSLLNNGYVNGFWEFDTGSGSTAYDSSGHNYDGTIYGASWTAGYSGYALDFDGVNDYVDLDAHSEDLGMNKTDDVIFSVYFKSTSTDGGYIYCMAGNDHVPEARIELLSNGSLSFKVWTNVCGILVYSDNTFNDNVWHHVEIFFNGITSNPTVSLYVDGDSEGSVTTWLCDIENNDFSRAKIGRRAYEAEGYFDGKIDELKIIKYPGGNDQNPPTIDGPTSGDPGVEYDFTFVTLDPEEDDIWLHIEWGDGNETDWLGPYESGEEAIVSYTWEEEDIYEIRAESKDIWDDSYWSDPYPVSIGNHPPGTPTITGETNGKTGVEYEYTFNAVDPDSDDVKYHIDWDDGDSDTTAFSPSGIDVKVKHTWSEEGTYIIRATAEDKYGLVGLEATLTVTMPRNKATNNMLFLRLLEQFPLLQKLFLFLN